MATNSSRTKVTYDFVARCTSAVARVYAILEVRPDGEKSEIVISVTYNYVPFIFAVAAVNLFLGYATALYFGRGPGRLPEEVIEPDTDTIAGENPKRESPPKEVAAKPQKIQTVDLPPREKTPFQIAVESLEQSMGAFRTELGQLDQQLRECQRTPSEAGFSDCAKGLMEAANRHQADYQKRLDELNANVTDLDALGTLCAELVDSASNWPQRVSDFSTAVEQREEDPRENCERLIKQISGLLESSLSVREMANGIGHLVTEHAETGGTPPADYSLKKTGRYASLDRLMRQARESGSPDICVGMVDIDNLGELNQESGPLVGDAILEHLTELIVPMLNESGSATSVGGGRFLFVRSSVDLIGMSDTLERVRQTVQRTRIQRQENVMEVTVSAATAPTDTDDSIGVIIDRLLTTLGEAKRYGRNRTFKHEDNYPVPVVPTELEIEETTVSI